MRRVNAAFSGACYAVIGADLTAPTHPPAISASGVDGLPHIPAVKLSVGRKCPGRHVVRGRNVLDRRPASLGLVSCHYAMSVPPLIA
ncbi:MAG: hypothetical protein QOG57_5386 [Pseudonocardiales bacterium]|nr:hypothetical protein [Pseudonocardiales bacterium]